MNDDIFPLVEKEFEGQVIGTELYELAHQYISQLLYTNVYTKAVKRYEVRIDENSVDIQLGDNNKIT